MRLNVPLELVVERLRAREGDDVEWYLHRAPELQEIMEERAIGDLVIDVGERTPADIAADIATRLQLAGPQLAQD